MEKCLVSNLEQEGLKDKRRPDHLEVAASRKCLKTNRMSKRLRNQFEETPTGSCEL